MKKQLLTLLIAFLSLTGFSGAANVVKHLPDKTEFSNVLFAPSPPGGFTYTPTSGCAPLVVQFNNNTPGITYNWNFGDPSSGANNTSILCNPVHVFNNAGTYTVTLVSSDGVNTYTSTDFVTVLAKPNPAITTTALKLCQYSTGVYTATSLSGGTLFWSTPGGNIISGQGTSTVTVKWNTYGFNQLTVTETNAAGCTGIAEITVKVVPPPSVNLPCYPTPRSQNGEGTPDDKTDSSYCEFSTKCFTATLQPGFGTPSDYTWLWTITNGTVVSGQGTNNACIQWGAAGTAHIKLEVTDIALGCKFVFECDVTIIPGITPALTINGQCVNTDIVFNASGSTPLASIIKYIWDFGDGNTATGTNPITSHKYAFPGTYTVNLLMQSSAGCWTKITKTVTIITGTSPTIDCPGLVCANSKICYTTPAVGTSYVWTVTGNASPPVINGNQVCVEWGSGPVGTVSVTVIGGTYTCSNSATISVPILGASVPVSAPISFCIGSFSGIPVSAPLYPGACYAWSATNATVSGTGNSVTVFPTGAGDITVSVVVTSQLTCCTGSGSAVIKQLKQYFLSGPSNVCENSSTVYTVTDPSGGTPNVSWNVNNGVNAPPSGNTTTVSWTTGPYGLVSATNLNPNVYCNTLNIINVKIWPKAAGSDIDGPTLMCVGSTGDYYHMFSQPLVPTDPFVTLTASSSIVEPTGYILTPVSPSHTTVQFTAAGSYHIVVKYFYNHPDLINCFTTDTLLVTVLSNSIPAISGPTSACQGDIQTFSAPMGNPAWYEWSVFGGNIISGLGTNTIQVQWASTVNSQVILMNKACGNKSTFNVTVHGKPIVGITVSGINCSGTSATLTVPPIWSSYVWSTGASGTNTISVSTPNTYSVTVGNGFCFTLVSVNLNPMPRLPKPDITAVGVSIPTQPFCPPNGVFCPSITGGPITSYAWTGAFGTASTSCLYTTVPVAPNPGYNYTLIVTNASGCLDTFVGHVDSVPCVIPSGGPGGPPCTSTATFSTVWDDCSRTFTSTYTNATDFFWLFGDGTTGTGPNPTHTYLAPCAQTVTTWVKDNAGCWKRFTTNINVNFVLDITGITVNPGAGICAYNQKKFTANGTTLICPGLGLSALYSWVFTPPSGPTVTSTLASPNITFTQNGTWTAQVTVTIGTCTRTATTTFSISQLKAKYITCNGCAGSAILFSDISTAGGAPIVQWAWTFGNGDVSNLQSPAYVYPASGTYVVGLTVTDNNGCTSFYSQNVTVAAIYNPGSIVVKKNGVVQAGVEFSFCTSDNYTLEAPAGINYQWSSGQATQIINITQSGVYYVKVFNAAGCVKELGPIKFHKKPQPTAEILGNLIACSSFNLRPALGAGYTYNWSGGQMGAFTGLDYFFSNSGVSNINWPAVTLQVVNQAGCSNSQTVSVTVKPSPAGGISASGPLCKGGSITLTANVTNIAIGVTYLWNNGLTTASIPVTKPGTYSVTVFASNGCKSVFTYTVQWGNLADVSAVPTGCYKICQTSLICGPIVPFGYTGQWFNGATPVSALFTGFTTATNLTISTSGTYTFKMINTATGCVEIGGPFDVQIISPPAFTIIPSGPTVLCAAGGSSITLTVSPCNPSLTYLWYLNGNPVPIAAGCSYVATLPGSYTVTAQSGNCCKTTKQIDIGSENCCFSPGVKFTLIPNGSVISTDSVFNGKYYIAGTLTVTGNAILDLTNVDCVFGPLGEIVFRSQSIVRANNSVFRPCHKDDIWKGFSFFDGSYGWINTSTFKNARNAVNISTLAPNGVRITDNTFSKCNIGVTVNGNSLQNGHSISGNTFEIDESQLNYGTSNYFGIQLFNANMVGVISQNHFRHVNPADASNIYYGIYSYHSSYTASTNTFTDMWRAADISQSSGLVTLEKNTIQLDVAKENSVVYQVRVSDNQSPLLLYANTFNNGFKEKAVNAIYMNKVGMVGIKDNQFDGFYNSIQINDMHNFNIASNEITNGSLVGIDLTRVFTGDVSCNSIKMRPEDYDPTTSNPIGITAIDCDNSVRIYTNCIFDCATSIYLSSSNNSYIPTIRNNMLFNYVSYGVYNNGYTGDIGTNNNFAQAGRNTFESNNLASGAFDIFSTVPLIQAGNFSVFVTTPNVATIGGIADFNSTASCGVQVILQNQNQLDEYTMCDRIDQKFLPIQLRLQSDGSRSAFVNYSDLKLDGLKQAHTQSENSYWQIVLGVYLTNADATGAGNVLSAVNQSTLTGASKLAIAFNYYLHIQDYDKAAALIAASKSSVQTDEKELAEIYNAILELAKAKNPVAQTDISNLATLSTIDDARGTFAAVARDVIQVTKADHDYIFTQNSYKIPQNDKPAIFRDASKLHIYPVPATNLVNILFNSMNGNVTSVTIFDGNGKKVDHVDMRLSAGKVEINSSALASGVYQVLLTTEHSRDALKGRFIKID